MHASCEISLCVDCIPCQQHFLLRTITVMHSWICKTPMDVHMWIRYLYYLPWIGLGLYLVEELQLIKAALWTPANHFSRSVSRKAPWNLMECSMCAPWLSRFLMDWYNILFFGCAKSKKIFFRFMSFIKPQWVDSASVRQDILCIFLLQ